MAKKASRKAAKPIARKQSVKRPTAARKASKSTQKSGKPQMASFKYVGDPNDRFGGPDTATVGKYTFEKGGDAVEITDKELKGDNSLRLVGNSHFVDVSDKETVQDVAEQQKALDKADADRGKAEEAGRKADEADRKKMEANRDKVKRGPGRPRKDAATAPRPPGTVTRDPMPDAFGGRTVEQRTQAEDHTKAGKTKGGGSVVVS